MSRPLIDPRRQLAEAVRLRALATRQEEAAVLGALRACGGNTRQAADLLAMPYTTLDRLLSKGRLSHLDSERSHRAGRPPSK